MSNEFSCQKCGSEGDQGETREVPNTYGTEFDSDYTCIECGDKWTVRFGVETYRLEIE